MAKNELSIVTGGSRGIGKGIALRLAKEGHNIILFARHEDALRKTQSEIKALNVECEYFSGDAGDPLFVNSSVKKIIDKYGRIDHLINNAGIGIFKNLLDAELDDFKQQVNVNLYGVFNFTKAAAPVMIKQKSGSVITISSLAGKNFFEGGSMYAATKHAVMGFCRSVMLELRQYNIRTALICPGSVNTEFFDETPTNASKILAPSDVAEAVSAIIKLPVRALISEIDIRPTNPK